MFSDEKNLIGTVWMDFNITDMILKESLNGFQDVKMVEDP
jgi:hypothetical protein